MDSITLPSRGDTVWVDEGDSYGCFEFRGIVETIHRDRTFSLRVNSHPVGAGVPTDSLVRVNPDEVAWWTEEGS